MPFFQWKARYIRLNPVAVAGFKESRKRSLIGRGQVFVTIQGKPLQRLKRWFDPAVEEADLRDFPWYCLRHTFAKQTRDGWSGGLTISAVIGAQDDSDDGAVQTSRLYP